MRITSEALTMFLNSKMWWWWWWCVVEIRNAINALLRAESADSVRKSVYVIITWQARDQPFSEFQTIKTISAATTKPQQYHNNTTTKSQTLLGWETGRESKHMALNFATRVLQER